VLVVGRPLEQDVGELLWGDVVSTDGVHVVLHPLASNVADTGPVIIISLRNVPVIRGQIINMSRSKSILGNNGTLLILGAGNSEIGGCNLRSVSQHLEGAIIGSTLLKGVSDKLHVLSVTHEDEANVFQEVGNASSVRGSTIVNGYRKLMAPASGNTVETSIHSSSIEKSAVLIEFTLIGNISHGLFEEEVHITPVEDSTIWSISNNRGTESAQFIDVLSEQEVISRNTKSGSHSFNFFVILRLNCSDLSSHAFKNVKN
jgi:hypothetical protein